VLLGTAIVCAYFPAARLYRSAREQLMDSDSAAADVFAYARIASALSHGPGGRPPSTPESTVGTGLHHLAFDRSAKWGVGLRLP